MRVQEAPNHKNRCPSQLDCISSIKIVILHNVFEDQITKYCNSQAKMMGGSGKRSREHIKAPNTTPLEILQINLFREQMCSAHKFHQGGSTWVC